MGKIDGPFEQTKFLGASVMSFSSSVGWNEQSSTVTVNLVEDKDAGDKFMPPNVGESVRFVFDGFVFEGLLQLRNRKNDLGGNPTYEVQITDPREILAGAQVIIAAFNQPTAMIPNLINAYGFYENKFGFGGSLVNDSGMLWVGEMSIANLNLGQSGASVVTTDLGPIGIKAAIESLTANGSEFGGPLQFRGHSYRVDLGGLPTPPQFYRIGGVARSIMDMINEVCQDGGHDYIVYLEDTTIKIKCVSRLQPPNIGSIANWIDRQDNVTSKSVGVELRNEVTNAVLLGGDVQELTQVVNFTGDDTIWPFWGMDVNGQPIVGHGMPESDHSVLLNASEIADIYGDMQYHCTVPELRFAAAEENAFDSWAAYVIKKYPEKAETIGLVSAIDSTSDLSAIFPGVMFQRDMIAQRDFEAYYFGRMNESDYWTERAQKVFNFVKRYATDYFGKRFWVKIPFFIFWKLVPETTAIVKSDDISDGGYVPEGSMPLGMQYDIINQFMTDDGRFECFVRFPFSPTMNLQEVSFDNAAISNDYLYMKATIDTEVGIQYPGGSIFPHVCVVLNEAVYDRAPDPLGGVADISTTFDIPIENLVWAAGVRHGSFPIRISPAPYRPSAVAIPMRSNRTSYGPWGTFPPYGNFGVPGKVYFDRDDSLVPWQYGDWETMNQAGMAQLANAATNMQESETGTIEMAGTPDHSLGDELVAGGPNLTGIRVSIDTSGIKTTYEMRTFTPVFGAFSKSNAERLKRLGTTAQQIRRNIRATIRNQLQRNNVVQSAKFGRMFNTSRAVRQMTPHECIYGTMSYDKTWGIRTQVSTATTPETLANVRGDSPDIYSTTGACSLEALYRPFSTQEDNEIGIPSYSTMNSSVVAIRSEIPCRWSLNPFAKDNDIDIMLWGDQFSGIHTRKSIANGKKDASKLPDFDNARLIGFRGPMMMVGWGFEYTGRPFPNSNEDDLYLQGPVQDLEWDFMDKHRTHPEYFKAAPIAFHYDKWRDVWTIPTILMGKLDDDYSSSRTNWMTIYIGDQATVDKVIVYNWLGNSSALLKDKKVVVTYYPLNGEWYITSAECNS